MNASLVSIAPLLLVSTGCTRAYQLRSADYRAALEYLQEVLLDALLLGLGIEGAASP